MGGTSKACKYCGKPLPKSFKGDVCASMSAGYDIDCLLEYARRLEAEVSRLKTRLSRKSQKDTEGR